MLIDIDTSSTEKMQLFIKLMEIGASFMVHKGIGNQAYPKSRFLNPDAVFDIFSQSGKFEPPYTLPNLSRYPHVEAAWMKSTNMFLISPNTARCKWRSHRITNCPLYGRKSIVSGIRTTI